MRALNRAAVVGAFFAGAVAACLTSAGASGDGGAGDGGVLAPHGPYAVTVDDHANVVRASSGFIDNVKRIGGGDDVVTFTSGLFDDVPFCTCTAHGHGNASAAGCFINVDVLTPTASQVAVSTYLLSQTEPLPSGSNPIDVAQDMDMTFTLVCVPMR